MTKQEEVIPPSIPRDELPEPPPEELRRLYREALGRDPEDIEHARYAYWTGLL